MNEICRVWLFVVCITVVHRGEIPAVYSTVQMKNKGTAVRLLTLIVSQVDEGPCSQQWKILLLCPLTAIERDLAGYLPLMGKRGRKLKLRLFDVRPDST